MFLYFLNDGFTLNFSQIPPTGLGKVERGTRKNMAAGTPVERASQRPWRPLHAPDFPLQFFYRKSIVLMRKVNFQDVFDCL